MRALLIGNYGTGNLGDEALREYFLQAFPRVEWQVISAHPTEGELPRLPAGFRSFFSFGWGKTVGAFRSADAVVFGGGTLFTDSESLLACILWLFHAALAIIFKKPLLLAFQGIGPFRTSVGEWCARFAVAHAVFVSVRDEATLRRVERWKLNKKIVLSFDPVYMQILKRNGDRTGSVLVVIPRGNATEPFRTRLAQHVRRASWSSVRIVSMAPEDPQEIKLCAALLATMKEQGIQGCIVAVRTIADLVRQMDDASFVLSQRYHGAVAALALGIPLEIVPQRAGDKLEDLATWATLQDGGGTVRASRVEEGRRALEGALAILAAKSGKNR